MRAEWTSSMFGFGKKNAPPREATLPPGAMRAIEEIPRLTAEISRLSNLSVGDHVETFDDVRTLGAQRAVLQLDVHAVERLQTPAKLLDHRVGLLAHARIGRTHEELVEIEHLQREMRLQLPDEGAGVAGDSAQFVKGADDGEARLRLGALPAVFGLFR